jgi:hypothetical protein
MISAILDSMSLPSRVIEFGCDTATYSLETGSRRDGVAFFARPGVARRGFQLGCLALREFHRLQPEQKIHIYGCPRQDLGFPAIHHQKLTPVEVNELYNRTSAGLALSFTNITLVAEEMLASGVVPVMNDSPYARAGISNPNVVWAEATPSAIAHALSAVVTKGATEQRARAAAESVASRSWRPSQEALVRIIEDGVYA